MNKIDDALGLRGELRLAGSQRIARRGRRSDPAGKQLSQGNAAQANGAICGRTSAA